MDESRTVQWRRDASTSRAVRVLWGLGAGTFLAAIVLIVFARLFTFAGLTAGQPVVLGVLVGLAATVLALAASSNPGRSLDRLFRYLPFESPADESLGRALDAAVGAVVVGALIFALTYGVGGGIGNALAMLTIPIALGLLVLSSFLQSVGTLDLEDGRLHLHEPEETVDLENVDAVSVRRVGDTAVVRLTYAQPDGRYVAGPRRLVVPPAVARELRALVASS